MINIGSYLLIGIGVYLILNLFFYLYNKTVKLFKPKPISELASNILQIIDNSIKNNHVEFLDNTSVLKHLNFGKLVRYQYIKYVYEATYIFYNIYKLDKNYNTIPDYRSIEEFLTQKEKNLIHKKVMNYIKEKEIQKNKEEYEANKKLKTEVISHSTAIVNYKGV